ncbi:phospholipase D-like domain-containing protein [Isoalcanivorax beigongshangi]|uniref:Phospholipase D-like domain-containing protein n=1 Tax=Isoalcanivorax beigongshangi TaxID=3238810 RepID=A0ABV4AIQ3_9GAMM
MAAPRRGSRSRRWLVLLALIYLLGALSSVAWRGAGQNYAGVARPATELQLLTDLTGPDADGERQVQQHIFDAVFALIDQAESLLVLDLFLFNDFQGAVPERQRALAEELTARLIARKLMTPSLQVLLITDPFNTLYGNQRSPFLERLRAAGVQVVITDLTKLADSNPSWSWLWRVCCQWLGNDEGGWLPNPVAPGKVTLRTYLALLNFKANHRKTVVADRDGDWQAIVMSANPHNGSSAHSNIGLQFRGPAALDVLHAELAVARFSAPELTLPTAPDPVPAVAAGAGATVQVVTERAIEDAVLRLLRESGAGDAVQLDMFYLSSRAVVQGLLAAHQRGAALQVLLDPNKDAFGREKNGIPNRPVAAELHAAGIPVRWCNTLGEQCHSKLVMAQRADGRGEALIGSANLTRRNLAGLNLEADVVLRTPAGDATFAALQQLFAERWGNTGAIQYSVDYPVYADERWWPRVLYRVMEGSGWASF